MPSKESKFVVGKPWGPFLTPGDPDDQWALTKTKSAGGLSLSRTPSTTQRIKRHWKRFWFVYCVGNVIFLAIFLPVFFLVAIPAIAQLVVNKSDLVLTEAILTQPKPDSVQLTLQTKVDLHLALTARIEDLPLYLYQKDYGEKYPYASFTIPGKKIRGNTTLGVNDIHSPILNQTTWEEFVHQIIFQKETSLWVHGQTNTYLGVLKSHVKLNKAIKTQSLNQFEGFSIANAGLVFNQSDGHNFEGNLTLPNPTHLTFQPAASFSETPPLKMSNYSPAQMPFPLKGILDISTAIKHLGGLLKTEAKALKGGNLTLDAITQEVHYDNELIPWYTNVLRQLTLTSEIPLKGLINNTIANLKSQTNFTSTLKGLNLSSLQGMGSDSGSGKVSRSEGDSDGPVSVATLMRRSKYIQEAFEGVDPVERDFMIDSFSGFYS
ncbi:hypothetical protein N7468_005431 [Penicillium chermesinum]|uniref:Uncharacterized protein n=1 Tax=Penicillium chermesinum TaxID=63820 RepID=A0A9W9NZE3_9EURO|nr:uncharacterized protein N7468_005431 [Penicillium chermesinum]KAJ5232475.1 hypothetical protein N7468_005431 [Penicillium chermesinum]